MNKPCFEVFDLHTPPPPPGFYRSTISGARYRTSRRGNRVLLVVHSLDGVLPSYRHVSDYFALEGVSPTGIATARQRLVRLYQACGIEPVVGQPIEPVDLFGGRLMVEIDHDCYGGEVRLKVVGYRTAGDAPF
jgi:hypothetical protein